jgi:hypothetical protein
LNPKRFHSASGLQSHRDDNSQQTFLDPSKESAGKERPAVKSVTP